MTGVPLTVTVLTHSHVVVDFHYALSPTNDMCVPTEVFLGFGVGTDMPHEECSTAPEKGAKRHSNRHWVGVDPPHAMVLQAVGLSLRSLPC